jgi:RNA polymerase I-specific transcription initiation factor RRN11
MANTFLFDSLSSRTSLSYRQEFFRTVYDILHLSLLRRDLPRARKAWAILIRCPEFEKDAIEVHWRIGLGLIAWGQDDSASKERQRIEYLRGVMVQTRTQVRKQQSWPVGGVHVSLIRVEVEAASSA